MFLYSTHFMHFTRWPTHFNLSRHACHAFHMSSRPCLTPWWNSGDTGPRDAHAYACTWGWWVSTAAPSIKSNVRAWLRRAASDFGAPGLLPRLFSLCVYKI